MIWKTGKIQVSYRADLDGGGKFQSPYFFEFLKNKRPAPFTHAFEWCSGPGFIGFSLLARGLIKHVTFADVDPEAIEFVRKTVRRNGLEDRVSFHVSDCFARIPKDATFDLVIGNPPSYRRLNPKHPLFERFGRDIKRSDPNWKSHRRFYSQVGKHLDPGAWVVVSAVEAESKNVFFGPPSLPTYDLRRKAPLSDFREMIRKGGLKFVGNFPFRSGPAESTLSFVVSKA